MKVAFIYPGQGSQAIGMGKNLYEHFDVAKDVLHLACDTLKQDLKTLMFDGPLDGLTLTENTQPALLCVSMMAQKVLEHELGKSIDKLAVAAAGHSLGEYSALTAAGCFTIEDAILLVKLRGNAMQKAVPIGEGAMAAILGLDLQTVEQILQDIPKNAGLVEIANDNAPGQIVVSGHTKAMQIVIEHAKSRGAKRVVSLAVSAPFHSSLMEPAALIMRDALSAIKINPFNISVFTNVNATPYQTHLEIPLILEQQITQRVRWVELIQNMVKSGIDIFIEVGAGKVLSSLVKRIAHQAMVYNFETIEDLENLTFL